MLLTHRPVESRDVPLICAFPRNEDELYFMYPKATFPLKPDQLRDAISQRSDSAVVEIDGEITAFANFYRWGADGCAIGNVIVSPTARGKGVARYLIRQMVGLAISKYAAKEVTVSCFNRNVAGLLLYPKLASSPMPSRSGKRKTAHQRH